MFVMRWASLLLLFAILLLGFGCIEQKSFPSVKNEQLSNTQEVDLDNDGFSDYTVYDFNAITNEESGMKVQRQVTVATLTSGSYKIGRAHV